MIIYDDILADKIRILIVVVLVADWLLVSKLQVVADLLYYLRCSRTAVRL